MSASAELERNVLCSMMIDALCVDDVLSRLDTDCFAKPQNEAIFRAIQHLNARGVYISELSIIEHLSSTNQLDSVGGEEYVLKVSAETMSSANVRHYCEKLIEYAQRRKLYYYAKDIVRKIEENDADVLKEAGAGIERILATRTTSQYLGLDDVIPQSYQAIQERANSKDGLTGVQTGFPRLNRFIGGWQKSDLIIVAARPSLGKTTLAMNFAISAARAGRSIGIISMEMSAEKLGERLIASQASFPISDIHHTKPSQGQWTELFDASEYLSKMNVFIDETPGLNIIDITMRAKRMKREKDICLLIIDYLTLASGLGEGSRRLEIETISRGLKGIAKTLDIPVIALSQLSRSPEKEERKPNMSDLRESGSIEQDADVVIFIWEPPDAYKKAMLQKFGISVPDEKMPLVREVFIDKHRNGPCASIPALFNGSFYRFEELTHE